jgi:mRNA interferase RelE/StbE
LSAKYDIAETKEFRKKIRKLDPKLYDKIHSIVYPQLRTNPFFGTNIKKLKGELEGLYRYRIGNYRLFYLIEEDKVIVIITSIAHRHGTYQ